VRRKLDPQPERAPRGGAPTAEVELAWRRCTPPRKTQRRLLESATAELAVSRHRGTHGERGRRARRRRVPAAEAAHPTARARPIRALRARYLVSLAASSPCVSRSSGPSCWCHAGRLTTQRSRRGKERPPAWWHFPSGEAPDFHTQFRTTRVRRRSCRPRPLPHRDQPEPG
jgi:hypothetical protein